MKYAVMSDVHGHLTALENALADARRCAVDRFVLLGDMTGSGPSPDRDVLSLCRSAFDVVVAGNYEVDYLSRESAASQPERAWVASLLSLAVEGDAAFTHRGLNRDAGRMVAGFGYTFDLATAHVTFDAMDSALRLVFIGHTHESAIWRCDAADTITQVHANRWLADAGSRYIVNVGSVGCPRSDDGASYVVYDSDSRQLEFRRLEPDGRKYRAE